MVHDAEPVPAENGARSVAFSVTGLRCGDTVWPQLDFRLQVRGIHRGLWVLPPPDGVAPALLRWPGSALVSPVPLAAVLVEPDAEADSSAAALYAALAPRDLALLGSACAVFAEALPADWSQRTTWVTHALALREAFQAPQWRLRYDTVDLQSALAIPRYEQLTLVLHCVTFGTRHWDRLVFRLGAAQVQDGGFTDQPKLEFPPASDGPPPFENWYVESDDDLGPRYELRFNIATDAMDIQAWQALSVLDQIQVAQLMELLPDWLTTLAQQGRALNRSWTQWIAVARALTPVLHRCTPVQALLAGIAA